MGHISRTIVTIGIIDFPEMTTVFLTLFLNWKALDLPQEGLF